MIVAVLGAGGQLGHILTEYLKSVGTYIIPVGHDKLHIDARSAYKDYAESLDYILEDVKVDYLINCIGATKPHFNVKEKLEDNIFTNAVWPHLLERYCAARSIKLIHITTDCIYDGAIGKYDENSKSTANDDYGQSKYLGECDRAMVIRTSIIGTERGSARFLISWVLGQDGKEVNGFTNHLWNGVTTLELSKRLHKIMKDELWTPGKYHTFGPDITKEELVKEIAAAFKVNVKVNPVAAKEYCDRRLRTVKPLNDKFDQPSHKQMLDELYNLWIMNSSLFSLQKN